MDYKTCCEIFGITDITFLPIAALKVVESSEQERHRIYRLLLEANNYDVSVDWFQSIYEAELSEGKRKGQHFTPSGVHKLVSDLAGPSAKSVHEPTAGTGSLVIGDWWNCVSQKFPWEVFPSDKHYIVWELSDRALPLLLINLSIRGIMATVYHGDVLEQTIKAKYILINRTDNGLGFSDIVPDPTNELRIVKV
ncbi:MAG: N-6 DNA methylase [Bacteroides sp.]|nr:N-6 DNA methylase [Bacteroides sp.]